MAKRRIGGAGGGSDPGTKAAKSDANCVLNSFGDITPLAGSLLGMAGIRFTANHYGSRRNGTTITIAEAESANGNVGGEALKVLADVSSSLPHP